MQQKEITDALEGRSYTIDESQLTDGGQRHDTMTINMGPQHPSTHGVLRLILTIEGEILVLLHSQYPQPVPVKNIEESLKARSGKSVRNRLGEMNTNKLIHGDAAKGYRLTIAGHAGAVNEIKQVAG